MRIDGCVGCCMETIALLGYRLEVVDAVGVVVVDGAWKRSLSVFVLGFR